MADSALIEELLRQYGENPRRVFARLANEYRKQGDLTTAIEICRTQVPLQPTYISGYIVLGQALFESGQLEEARATFEAAIGLDPENLIALRQLGDIARLSGEVDGARGWYYRLLEVDPQNDDVGAHVRALEKAPAEPAVVRREGEPVSWSDINPERSSSPPAPVIPPLPRVTLGIIPEGVTAALSASPAPSPVTGPETSAPSAASAPSAPSAPSSPSVPSAAAPTPSTVEPIVEFAGLEDLARFQKPIAPPRAEPELLPDVAFFAPTPRSSPIPGGTAAADPARAPASSAGAPSARPMPEATSPSSFVPRPAEGIEEEPPLDTPVTRHRPLLPTPSNLAALRDTLMFTTPVTSPAVPASPSTGAPPPAATAPVTPLVPSGPAASLSALASLASPVPPLAPPPAPAAPPVAPTSQAPDRRAAVDNFGSVADPESLRAPSQEEGYDPTIGRMLDLTIGQGGEVPAGFMTETMAELYLQQGYQEEALKIYRQLALQRPDDATLRDRIARLEIGARSSLPSAASVSEDVISAARDRATRSPQSIRSFFGGLAARRAPGGAPAANPLARPSDERAAPSPTVRAPTPNGDMDAALDGVFGGSTPPAADEAAASALAAAFSEDFTDGTTPAGGQPAHAASLPLSLDAVFRGPKAPAEAKRAPQSVTFDEFFAPRESGQVAAVHSSAPDGPAEPGGARPEMDLALFHEWLDGLKK